MPYHFAATDSPYDPDTNVARGLDYLRRSLQAANNDARRRLPVTTAASASSAAASGPGPPKPCAMPTWGSGIYADAIVARTESSRLNEWLTAGAVVCAPAPASQKIGIGSVTPEIDCPASGPV